MSVSDQTPHAEPHFLHSVLIVDSDETLRERLVPALRRALRDGEAVLMVVHPHTEQVVRDSLGDQAADLNWGDTQAFYQRLGFTFETFRRYLARQHAAGQRVYIVAEPDIPAFGSEAALDRVAAYLSYEAVCNDAFAGYGCPLTCIWDSRRHPTLVIEGARDLHKYELSVAGPIPNPDFIPVSDYLARRSEVASSHRRRAPISISVFVMHTASPCCAPSCGDGRKMRDLNCPRRRRSSLRARKSPPTASCMVLHQCASGAGGAPIS